MKLLLSLISAKFQNDTCKMKIQKMILTQNVDEN